jgi:hypothetical protein
MNEEYEKYFAKEVIICGYIPIHILASHYNVCNDAPLA